MTAGIVGLGLIGGSFAKAYSAAGHTVYAYDTDQTILSFAILSNAVKAELTDERLKECDIILVCVYPEAVLRFMEEKGPLFGARPVIIDCCGTKRNIVDRGRALAKQYGFTYVGGHPMAGTQFSGFRYAKEDLFSGAPMVLIPEKNDDIVFLDKLTQLLSPAGFARFTVTTPETHDRVIAFTSQLAHVVSNAYIKSPTAAEHLSFSAGSYRDLTRVAKLNETMWTELFLDNAEYLGFELDCLIRSLQEYRDAIAAGDAQTLRRLLKEGRERKEAIDTEWKE